MNTNLVKKLAISILAIYAVGLTGFEVASYAQANETVLSINDYKLTRHEATEQIMKDSWQDSLSTFTDKVLIMKEAKIEGISTPTQQELEAEADILLQTERRQVDLSIPTDKELITERVIVKKLAEKYTVNDAALNSFLSVHGDDQHSHVLAVHGVLFEADHAQLDQIEEDLQKQISISEVEKKYNLKAKAVQVDAKNEYNLELQDLHANDIKHLHTVDKHVLLVVQHVQEETLPPLKDNDKALMINYLNKEYYAERVNVINYLRSIYNIEIKENAF